MNKVSGWLRGVAVLGGLALASVGWAQGQTPDPPDVSPPAVPGSAPTPGAPGTAPTVAPGTVPTGLLPMGKIMKVTILGTKNVGPDTVTAAIAEKVGDEFDAATAEKDREAISALGYWTGPAQFAVLSDIKGGVDLTFTVVENPVVQSIKFNANTLTGEPTIPAATLLAQMATKPGQVLNNNTLQSDLDTLFNPNTGFARKQGYRFTAGSSIHLGSKSGVLTIPVVEDYVQAVIVTGNKKTPTKDIVSALPVKAGQLYQDQAVQQGLAPGRSAGGVRITGPAQVAALGPGRVAITVPVQDGR